MKELRDVYELLCPEDRKGLRRAPGARLLITTVGLCEPCLWRVTKEIRSYVLKEAKAVGLDGKFLSSAELVDGLALLFGRPVDPMDLALALAPARPRVHRISGKVRRGYSVFDLLYRVDWHTTI